MQSSFRYGKSLGACSLCVHGHVLVVLRVTGALLLPRWPCSHLTNGASHLRHIVTDGCPRAAGTFSSLHITYSNTDCRAVASKQPVRLLKRLQDSGKNKRGHSIGSALVSTAAQLINLTQSEEDRRRDLAPCLKTQNVDFKSVCFCY